MSANKYSYKTPNVFLKFLNIFSGDQKKPPTFWWEAKDFMLKSINGINVAKLEVITIQHN